MGELLFLNSAAGCFMVIMIIEIAAGILDVSVRVIAAFSAYFDAKVQNNRYGLMWPILIGFFGLIPAVIYLFMRKNPSQLNHESICPRCRFIMNYGTAVCPNCGMPQNYYEQYTEPAKIPKYRKRSLILLIIAVILKVIETVLVIVLTVQIFGFAFGDMCAVPGYMMNI